MKPVLFLVYVVIVIFFFCLSEMAYNPFILILQEYTNLSAEVSLLSLLSLFLV